VLETNLHEDVLVLMGENHQIDEVVEELLGLNKQLDHRLSANSLLTKEQLDGLYAKYGDEFILEFSSNPKSDSKLLEEFYTKGDEAVVINIASNPSTPQAILDELGEKNIHKFNRGLAINSSTKLIYLEQFALDSELIMLMTKNETYLASVNSAHVGRRNDDRY
jgi:hypothetical protein